MSNLPTTDKFGKPTGPSLFMNTFSVLPPDKWHHLRTDVSRQPRINQTSTNRDKRALPATKESFQSWLNCKYVIKKGSGQFLCCN